MDVVLTGPSGQDGRCSPFVAPYISPPARRMLVPFGRNGEPLDWPLVVYFGVDDYATGRNPNRAVRTLVEGRYPDAMLWCGPMVVLKASNKDMGNFVDVSCSDIEDVRSFFGQL